MPCSRSVRLRAALTVGVGCVLSGLVLAQTPGPVATRGDAPSVVASRNQVDTASRDAVRAAYLDRWASAADVDITGGGTASGCHSAGTPATQQAAIKAAVNFARGLVGLNAVSFSSGYDSAAAQAALIMAANKKLSHDPPRSWKCWTEKGHAAAGRSNILITSGTPSATGLVGLYLDDAGSTNTAAGHRRWLLRPETTTMGSGGAQGDWFGNALYVVGSGGNSKAAGRSLYTWPAAGYFPGQLEPGGRWSISARSPKVSFAAATVTVTGPSGTRLGLTKRKVENGYADNTLVWDLARVPGAPPSTGDTYTVTVRGIRGWSSTSYTYRVRLFDPTR